MLFNFLFKLSVEVAFTPLTYFVVGRLKTAEGVDTYDRDTDFTPFSLKDDGQRLG
jgi:queuosine precursor transporter